MTSCLETSRQKVQAPSGLREQDSSSWHLFLQSKIMIQNGRSVAHNFAKPPTLEYWKQYLKLQTWRLTTNLWIHVVYLPCPVSARSFLSSSNSFSLSLSHSRTLWRTCVSSPVTCKLCINCTQNCVIRTQIFSVITMKNKQSVDFILGSFLLT